MNFRLASSCLIVALALPGSAMAGGLLDNYLLARNNDPQLKAADATRLAQAETKDQSVALLLPNISISANTDDVSTRSASNFAFNPSRDEGYNSHGYSLTLRQPVYHHDYWVGLRQADATVAQAEADYGTAKQDLMIRLASGYFDLLAAQDNLDFARAEKEATARQLEQAKQRFEVGLIAITDVHEAQAQYDLTVAQEIGADNLLANAREALQEITGQYEQAPQLLQDEIPLLSPDPTDIEQWVKKATDQNLGLKSAQFARQVASEETNRQRSGHYPTLDIVASRSDSISRSVVGGETDTDRISLQLNVPIFAGGAVSSRTRQAAYRAEAAKQNLLQTRRSVVRQTRNAYLGVIAEISRVNALRQAVISSAKANEATQAGFEVGTRTIVDVLLSQRELFRAKRDHARSRYDYILNTLRLKQAAGSLAQVDIEAIDKWLK
ncbi:MAG: TolC family outer membrane protein [Sulfuriflexus sp.]|nr:TolC family outer membrane protein [Sulfuriflexus sp.]